MDQAAFLHFGATAASQSSSSCPCSAKGFDNGRELARAPLETESKYSVELFQRRRRMAVWAILAGMTALAITVGVVTIMVHDRIQ